MWLPDPGYDLGSDSGDALSLLAPWASLYPVKIPLDKKPCYQLNTKAKYFFHGTTLYYPLFCSQSVAENTAEKAPFETKAKIATGPV